MFHSKGFLARFWLKSGMLFIFFGLLGTWIRAEGPLALQERVVDIFESKQKAVVRVLGIFPSDEADKAPMLQVGTGFLISKEGHILTNANIVDQASLVYVECNKKSYEAILIGADAATNISILKIENSTESFDFLGVSDSSEGLKKGSFLLAISCEMGLEPCPSLGILTGYNLYYGDKTLPTTCIRSDIPSDGGEGGSPVFDINGRFVGMIMASLVDIRSCFIIPARAIVRIRDDILFAGAVAYGYFGLRIDEESAIRRDQPLLVAEVRPNSPAAKAGIRQNDILLSIDGVQLKELADLHNSVFFSKPGQFLSVQALRKGESLNLSLQVGSMDEEVSIQKLDTEGTLVEPALLDKEVVLFPDHQPKLDATH